MPSVIDLCNDALDRLGQRSIMSLNDGDKDALLCKRNWPLVRDKLLRGHPWNFAIRRSILSPSASAPAWGFNYKSPLPDDFLRLVEVLGMGANEYRVESGAILSNSNVLRIRYVARIEDPNEYDALFSQCAALSLAIQICEPITQSTSKRAALMDELREQMTEAVRTNAIENPPAKMSISSWLTERF